MVWETVERPGYFGKKRDELSARWDAMYPGGWRLAYAWGFAVVEREFALQLYEDAYYEYFKRNPDVREWLLETASDVYDTAESNAGQMSYVRQETPNNHIHDVAIRRSIMRLGAVFRGPTLVHVRWIGSAGFVVNPGVVPFHLPHMIDRSDIADHGGKGLWWRPGTVEDFYQRNKLLQVHR